MCPVAQRMSCLICLCGSCSNGGKSSRKLDRRAISYEVCVRSSLPIIKPDIMFQNSDAIGCDFEYICRHDACSNSRWPVTLLLTKSRRCPDIRPDHPVAHRERIIYPIANRPAGQRHDRDWSNHLPIRIARSHGQLPVFRSLV